MKQIKKMAEIHRINNAVVMSYTLLTISLLVAYLLEYLKGNRTAGYTLFFSLLAVVPYMICAGTYRKNRESVLVKYIFSIGFSVLYVFVLLTAAVPTTFVYIFLALFLLIPYGDLRLCYITGGTAVAANIFSVLVGFLHGSLTETNLAMVEIQLVSITYAALFTGMATIVIGKTNAQKLGELDQEKERVEELLGNALNLSEQIAKNIEFVSLQMKQLEESVVVTESSMNDVSSGARETAESMQKQLSRTRDIVELVEQASKVSSVITTDMEEAKEAIRTGKENIDLLLSQVSHSKEANTIVASKMEELLANTEKMNMILEMIQGVTKKTNLLSLNATIEAARAGEAGRGFSVVAGEISDLASQTDEATAGITKLIQGIAISIEDVVRATNQLVESNEKQNHSAETMAMNFAQIEQCTYDIGEVSISLDHVVKALRDCNTCIVENIDTVSAITEEVAARANETLVASQNNASAVLTITNVMEELNEEAKRSFTTE